MTVARAVVTVVFQAVRAESDDLSNDSTDSTGSTLVDMKSSAGLHHQL